MTIEYVIENIVIYNAGLNLISKVGDMSTSMSIPIPASMCFRLLLEDHGNVVSQSILIDKVWHERGMSVSMNTLYQNISLLRKALDKLGAGRNIIKTVPKRGFVIPAEVSVRVGDAVLITPVETEDSVTLAKRSDPQRWWGKTLSVYHSCLFLFVFLCAVFGHWRYSQVSIPSYSFSTYQEIDSFDDCKIFRNPSRKKDSNYTEMLMRNGIVCGDDKWWYITNNPPSLRFSVLMCRDALNDKSDNFTYCESHYFLGMK